MSPVELKEHYNQELGNYIKHEAALLKYPTITVSYEHGCFRLIDTKHLTTVEEIDRINRMDPETFFEFITDRATRVVFSVNSITTYCCP